METDRTRTADSDLGGTAAAHGSTQQQYGISLPYTNTTADAPIYRWYGDLARPTDNTGSPSQAVITITAVGPY